MILIGVLLLGAAAAALIDVWLENSTTMLSLQVFGQTWSTHLWVVLLAAAGCGLIGLLGLFFTGAGAGRMRRLRAERRGAIRDRDRLAEQAARERTAREQLEAERAAAVSEAERSRTATVGYGPADEQARVDAVEAERARLAEADRPRVAVADGQRATVPAGGVREDPAISGGSARPVMSAGKNDGAVTEGSSSGRRRWSWFGKG